MLKTNIYARHIQNLTDARYFAAAEVGQLSFCLEEGNPDFVAPITLQAIRGWVAGPQIVGSFGLGQSADEIRQAAQSLQLDAVQLGHFAEVETAQDLGKLLIYKEVVIEHLEKGWDEIQRTLKTWEIYCQGFLLDFTKINTTWADLEQNWRVLSELKALCTHFSVYLHLDCAPESVETLLAAVPCRGLVVQGGAEEKVGFKSFDELDWFFEAVRD